MDNNQSKWEQNQEPKEQARTYGDESRMYQNQPDYSQQQSYGQPNYSQQPNYGQPNAGGYYNVPEPQHGPVTNVFCYILLVIMPLRIILAMIYMGKMFSSMTYYSVMSGRYMSEMLSGGYLIMSGVSSLLSIAFLVFIIVDIVMVHKQNYKITGLILFAIFLNPGYYIWRAHILGQKMIVPIIYTVAYALLMVSYWIYAFYAVFEMTWRIMGM